MTRRESALKHLNQDSDGCIIERGRAKSEARSRTTSTVSDEGLADPGEGNSASKSKSGVVNNKVKQASNTTSEFHENRHHSQGQFPTDPYGPPPNSSPSPSP